MAKKQTRKSVSLRGTTYERIKIYCDERKISMSGFCEMLVAEKLGPLTEDELEALRKKVEEEPVEKEPKKIRDLLKKKKKDEDDDGGEMMPPSVIMF